MAIISNITYTQSIKNYNHKTCNMTEFLNVVKKRRSCICIYTTLDTVVKPYFDFDIKREGGCDHEFASRTVSNITNTLSHEFATTIDHIHHTDNSRISGNKYKYSYHFFIDGYKTNGHELKAFGTYWNSKYEFQIDTAVYRTNGLLRFANQMKNIDDVKPRLSTRNLKKYIITLVDNNDKDFIFHDEKLPRLIGKGKPLKKKPKAVITHENLYTDTYLPTREQIVTIRHVLHALSSKYYDDYTLWRNIGFCLKSFSNIRSILELYIEFSKRSKKYRDGDCEKIWRCRIVKNGLSIGTLIMYLNLDNELHGLNTSILMARPINIMVDIESIPLDIVDISREYITNSNGDCDLFNIETLRDKMIIIKSHTGSGKTCLMEYIRKVTKSKYNIISITSRRSLAKKHAEQLKLSYYEDAILNNLAVQLDSIDRVRDQSKKPFILFLDEIDSIIDHLRNHMAKMCKKRCFMIHRLFSLINSSRFTLAVDADVSTCAIRYIKANIGKPITLYWNRYVLKDKCNVVVHSKPSTIIKEVLKIAKTGIGMMVCSDRFAKFEKNIVIPIMKKMRQKDKDRVLFFSSIDGDKDEFMKTNEWKDKIVFCTPTVLYGIDCNYSGHVIGFYYGASMNSRHVCQQLARIRKPIKIQLYFDNIGYHQQFFSIEDVATERNSVGGKLSTAFTAEMAQKWSPDMISSYKDYVFEKEYLDSAYANLHYHVLDILKSKGHSIQYIDDGYKIKCMGNEEYIKLKMKRLDKLMKVLEIELDAIDKDKLALYEKRINMLKLDDIDCDELTEIQKMAIVDNNVFDTILKIKQFQRPIDKLESELKSKQDMSIELIKTDKFKILCLRKLMNKMEFDVFKFDFKDFINNCKDMKAEFKHDIKDVKKAFNLRGKKYNDDLNIIDGVKLILSLCSSIFGDAMTPTKIKINTIEYRYNTINGPLMESYLKMI